MPAIPNTITGAPREFNDGAHLFSEIGLDNHCKQALEAMTADEAAEILEVIQRVIDRINGTPPRRKRKAKENADEPSTD